MNIILDIGNTKTKIYFFEADELCQSQSFLNQEEEAIKSFLQDKVYDRGIISCSGPIPDFLNLEKLVHLDANLNLPIQLNYKTPQTLGSDRIALACGANYLYPNTNCLIISTGTCITIDLIDDKGVYQGGIITPGITIRLQSLHNLTENLPLLDHTNQTSFDLIGKSTVESMESGIYNGALAEVKQTIQEFKAIYQDLTVIITGGDSNLFELHLKNKIFAQQNLQAIGLNRILIYNAE